jgi:hypothetical protein
VNQLLAEIVDAHGGFDQWKSHEKVEATIVSGGGFFPFKGVAQGTEGFIYRSSNEYAVGFAASCLLQR